jgi:hypothetical protein
MNPNCTTQRIKFTNKIAVWSIAFCIVWGKITYHNTDCYWHWFGQIKVPELSLVIIVKNTKK